MQHPTDLLQEENHHFNVIFSLKIETIFSNFVLSPVR